MLCFRGIVHCFLCHQKLNKNSVLRHLFRQHKHLNNDKLRNLAAKLTFLFSSDSKKYLCIREDCLAVVARKRNHEHNADLIRVKKRGDIPLSIFQMICPKEITGDTFLRIVFLHVNSWSSNAEY